MSRDRCLVCGCAAVWMAETLFADEPLCDKHFEQLIARAEEHNVGFGPGVVRSCMERAAYRIGVGGR